MNFAFDRAHHDRAAHLRKNPAEWEGANCKYMVFGGEHVATAAGPRIAWLQEHELPSGDHIFLGEIDGQKYGAVLTDRVPKEFAPTSVRTLAPQLPRGELSLAIHAVAMGRWLANNRHCPRCGEEVEIQESGHLLHCPACMAQHFPRTDPAVIMLVIDEQDRALIARDVRWPERRFSTLAGFVEPGESLEDAVCREVWEEVGVKVDELTYFASQPWPFPTSLMLGFHAKTANSKLTIAEDEIAEARWFTRDQLREATHSGEVQLPPTGVSISSWLIEEWLGEPVHGSWQ